MKKALFVLMLIGLVFAQDPAKVVITLDDIQIERTQLVEAEQNAVKEVENWKRSLERFRGALVMLDVLERKALQKAEADTTKTD